MDPRIEQILQRLATAESAITTLQDPDDHKDHQHNGFDTSRVNFVDIAGKKVWVHHTIQGTAAATAGNYSAFWIAPFACVVTGFREVHAVLGTDGSAVTLGLEKLTGTTAPGSGSALLGTALSLKSTINTVQTATIITVTATKTLAIGDRLGFKLTGTPTAVANVTGVVELTVL